MQERRKCPRFEITEDLGLTARVDGFEKNFAIMVFGAGGFGFCASAAQPANLKSGERILLCRFEWPSILKKPISISGKLRYASKVPSELFQEIYSCGIEFLPDQAKLAAPIVKELEKLFNEQKVAASPYKP